ncbi:MAG: putative lipid II flippase FtsW [Dehalococcoidia bacterium]|nr:putative lipid II flippase FtsW [Dehalococcoidia bacterium]
MARVASRPRVARHAPDYLLLTTVIVLLLIGLIAVYSSSYAVGYLEFDDANYFIRRQAVGAAVGFLALVVAMNIDYRILLRLSPLLMLGALATLSAVLVPGFGVEAYGAESWLQVGPLPAFQPSEFAKLAVLIYLAAWLASKGTIVQDFALGVVPFVGMVGIVGALIMLQPDFGTFMIVALITGTLFFVAGARLSHVMMLVATVGLTAVVLVLSGGHRMDRLLSFTDAESDPLGVGFHTLQLLVAFGSGGITGMGLGVSRQKFGYVYGSHTDGIMAIIGEELGLIGTVLVILLFALLLWRGWLIARRAADPFGSLIATGVVAWIGFQMLINVGGVTRLIPFTGVPLPFISFGSTALIATMAAVGVLLSVSRYAALERVQEEPSRGVLRRHQPSTGGAR